MKRLSLLILLLMALPLSALAVPSTPYVSSTVLGYDSLTPAVQSLVDVIYEGVSSHRETISLPGGSKYNDADQAVRFVLQAYPELPETANSWTISYYSNHPDEATSVTVSYMRSQAEDQRRQDQALARAKALQPQDLSGFELELQLHDTLCAATVYNLQADGCSTAWGALVGGQALCEGYAKAFTLLCRVGGIPCGVISGVAMDTDGSVQNHAWVEVELGGAVYTVDPTWDDQEFGVVHYYFNLSREEANRDHQADADTPVMGQDAGDAMEYHRYLGLACTQSEADSLFLSLLGQVGQGSDLIELRLTQGSATAFAQRLGDLLDRYNRSGGSLYGSYTYSVNEEQGCLRFLWEG